MKRLLTICSFSLLLLAFLPDFSYAQILTDSDRRLKTERKEKSNKGGFFGLFNKRKTSPGIPRDRAKAESPRTTSSPFLSFNKRRKVSPRVTQIDRRSLFRSKRTAPTYQSSSGSPFLGKKYKREAPRSISGSPFKNAKSSVSPRYSSAHPFSRKEKRITPRYSPGSPFKARYSKTEPRSESGSPFRRSKLSASPRYSPPGSPFERKIRRTTEPRSISGRTLFGRTGKKDEPRYSQAPKNRNARHTVSPRYSEPKDGKAKYSVTPRYSEPNVFGKKDKKVTPRYSEAPKDRDIRYSVTPRYSDPDIFSKKEKKITPRYSQERPDIGKREKVAVRTSPGSPFENKKNKISPRYSVQRARFDEGPKKGPYTFPSSEYDGGHKMAKEWYANLKDILKTRSTGKFEGNPKVRYLTKEDYKASAKEGAGYEGGYKERWLWKRKKHPSYAHQNADQDIKLLREGYKKWNIFLVRLNGNIMQPDAVKEKVSKPKFDRKEAKIWND